MPLQDLTPQLRTRLNRVERGVGFFVLLAAFLLLCGFGYFIYHTAEARGWFAIKARYYAYAASGTGLQVGDNVTMMGFPVGHIIKVTAMPPRKMPADKEVFIEVEVVGDFFGYLWTEGSAIKFSDSGFLGKRELEVTEGAGGYSIFVRRPVRQMDMAEIQRSPDLEHLRLGEEIVDGSNVLVKAWSGVATNLDRLASLGRTNFWVFDTKLKFTRRLSSIWDKENHHYDLASASSAYELPVVETPGLSDRIAGVITQVQTALPGILDLTNKIAAALSNTVLLTSNLNVVASEARVTVTNLAVITSNLREPHGSLGEWLLPTNVNQHLDATMVQADDTLRSLDTNLQNLNTSLINLGGITSNLNVQVQANSNLLTGISTTVVNADDFIQGLKRFWLFKHTFATPKKKASTNNAPQMLQSPKAADER